MTMNEELDKINQWLLANELVLNVNKSKYILLHHRQKNIDDSQITNIVMNGTPILSVNKFNFLGFILDEHLTWKDHINKIANKISRTNGILCRIKKTVPIYTLKLICNSLTFSHLNYGQLLWGSANSCLPKLRKKSIRTISNAKYNAHTDPLFKNLP